MTHGPIRLTRGARTTLRPATAARITDGFWAARRRTNAEVSIPQGPAKLEVREEPELLGGVSVVSAGGVRRSDGAAVRLTAVPYCVWANRRQGPTRVWIPQE
ncbi:hypothetical protein PV963_35685 [Streptomyces coeruleorubidus]|uniref:hypothetical protein n=1 Tax=Streptomyces coeruleorubidus TaxID=116188 RepID=UPI00237F037D|nr:hypothetical protein [Streptomyces coeruleorubidus]WDV55327.1 hypothetical protein PV963_35685 [Streptomyces coeruleorubidus]